MNVLSATFSGDYLAVRVRASAPAAAAAGDEPRRAINIGVILDTSGSMSGGRLDSVKRTLRAARGLFQPGDRVTLVTFEDRAQVIKNHHTMDAAGLDDFYTAVDAIVTGGSTNLSAGIEALYGCGTDYDMVLILTDGIINAGVAASAGLEAMLNAPGRRTINTFGYGEDHCRALLRDLALKSRGAYTFIDNDEILPIAMGDMLSGLREEVLKQAELSLPAASGWRCAELDGGAVTFRIGNIGPDRDYWYIFEKEAAAAASAAASPVPITLTAADGYREELAVIGDAETLEAKEQVLRCRVARVMSQVSDALEAGRPIPKADAEALKAEIEVSAADFRVRPLVLRLQGQIAEILATEDPAPLPATPPLFGMMRGGGGPGLGRSPAAWPSGAGGGMQRTLAARMASGMTCMSNQRGVYSGGDPDRDASEISLFSSPTQRSASQQVQAAYAAPVPAPVPAPAPADPHDLPVTPSASQD